MQAIHKSVTNTRAFDKKARVLSILSVQFDLLMLPNALNIAPVTHSNIGIVAAKQNLIAFGDDIAVADSGIYNGLCAAVANGFNFLNCVRHFH
jgi:hypothetical protein